MVELFTRPVDVATVLSAIGDSITARGDSAAGNFTDRTLAGYLSWVRIRTRQRFYCPPAHNFGVNGETTGQMLARISDVLAVQPSVCIVHAGTNDLSGASASSYADIIANLTGIYDALASIGCAIIAIPITGRSSPNALSDDNKRRIGQRVNQWIRSQSYTRKRFYVADASLSFDDPKGTAWTERSGMTEDGIHSGQVGAYTLADKVVSILNALYPADFFQPFANPIDTYDATYDPTGNILTNGNMAGSTAAGIATGNVATGWNDNFSVLRGSAAAYSKVTLADGRDATQLDLSGNINGSTGSVELGCSVDHTKLASGEAMQAAVDVTIGANAMISGLLCSLQVTVGGVTTYARDGVGNQSFPLPPGGYSGTLLTPRLAITGTPTSAALILRTQLRNAGVSTPISGTIQWASAAVRKVA